jgi:acyl-coenzyme A synthetase/AMP-(fatty) acid ligase/acyl carrier protein
VIYTSGSTGVPKGVSVPQRGVVRLVKNTTYASFDASEVFLQLAPVTFDASTFEIWGALLNGARLVLMPSASPSLDELGAALQQYGVTTLWLTAGLFHLMVDERLEALTSLKQLLAGGDVLSVAHVERFLRAAPEGCRLINGYGPTESTTFTCCYVMTREMRVEHTVPIGQPIANTQVYVLDKYLQPVPVGVAGELYIGGAGLGRGYHNRAELTAERFVPNPFVSGGRLYRTGDITRYRADGTIEFLGRRDHQVKIRGFRIELGEIEALLSQAPRVREVVVIVREDVAGDKRIVAYMVCEGDAATAPSAGEWRDYVGAKLPDYMIPSAFVVLDEMPLTLNGKVDRAALPAPENVRHDAAETFVAPRTPLEETLASIWSEVIGMEKIGVYDDFFELGGHSLLATQVISRVRDAFNVTLPLRALFESPVIATLAELIEQAQKEEPTAADAPTITPVSRASRRIKLPS